ncbi:MAG: hypothetical protein AB1481_07310 [Candidatus Omnitrophota bacterium]
MLTIAWDIDDVLNDLMRLWLENYQRKHRNAHFLKYIDIRENPPHKLLGISKERYLASLDEFRLSGKYEKITPLPEVKRWFLRHGEFFRHIAVSAVPVSSSFVSAEWLFRHFGRWIRSFHFVPSLRNGANEPRYDKSKEDFLRWLGKGDIFIDDNETNIRECKELGIKCILFPRPWNKSKLTISQMLKILK